MTSWAEVVLPCPELEPTLAFFTERLGFAVVEIFPADAPRVAVIRGHGLSLRLQAGPGEAATVVRIPAPTGSPPLTAPNGTRIEFFDPDPAWSLPPGEPSYAVTRLRDESPWVSGRAGMRYRDLLPDRQGGRFIASHIAIPEGGPVPDYVHYHVVRFQLIYCYRGWVRLAYEDQGDPFVLRAGDCLLQPPRIRHRVLEASPGLEVIEIGSPAEHRTVADPELERPSDRTAPERTFDGQRFVLHRAEQAQWGPWRVDGFEARDSGIAAATGGLAAVRVARWRGGEPITWTHDAEFVFGFVLAGGLALQCGDRPAELLHAGDCYAIPARTPTRLAPSGPDLELLDVTLPAFD